MHGEYELHGSLIWLLSKMQKELDAVFRIQKKLLKHCNRNCTCMWEDYKTVTAKKTKSAFVHVGM